MGKFGGNENEVAGTHGFGVFAVAAPTDLSTAAEHVNYCFLLAVVVYGTSGMWLGDHYAATVVSSAFAGKSKVQQHQMVYGALGGRMGGVLHALKLTTMAPKA